MGIATTVHTNIFSFEHYTPKYYVEILYFAEVWIFYLIACRFIEYVPAVVTGIVY